MKIKEPFNAVSHAIGAVLAILALILLIRESIDPIKPWHILEQQEASGKLHLLYIKETFQSRKQKTLQYARV